MMKFHDAKWIKEKTLNGPRMLGKGDPEKIIYSFTLYEKTTQGNLLRVQTDNSNQPFNFNKKDNQFTMSLGSAFRRSVNLVFIRLMRDIVNYHIFQGDRFSYDMLRNADHPKSDLFLILPTSSGFIHSNFGLGLIYIIINEGLYKPAYLIEEIYR